VAIFSADLAHIFTTEIGAQPAEDTAELQLQISGRATELSLDQREKRKLAKRIIKSIQPFLEDAIRKETELSGLPFEKELKELDAIFESGVLSRRISVVETGDASSDHGAVTNGLLEAEPDDRSKAIETEMAEHTSMTGPNGDIEVLNDDRDGQHAANNIITAPSSDRAGDEPIDVSEIAVEDTISGMNRKNNDINVSQSNGHVVVAPTRGPLTPPLSSQGDQQQGPLAQGGIQWYMQPFDPIGTTIHEERWTGRDVMRCMSEELSELDDEELEDLLSNEEKDGANLSNGDLNEANGAAPEPVKVHRTRRRWRGSK
jgi:NuA3 HAT complex component NTO1